MELIVYVIFSGAHYLWYDLFSGAHHWSTDPVIELAFGILVTVYLVKYDDAVKTRVHLRLIAAIYSKQFGANRGL